MPDGSPAIAQSPEDLRAKVAAQAIEGVLLPHGAFYGFKAKGGEPPVMIRAGAAAYDGVGRRGRIQPDGSEMRGASVESKRAPRIISQDGFR